MGKKDVPLRDRPMTYLPLTGNEGQYTLIFVEPPKRLSYRYGYRWRYHVLVEEEISVFGVGILPDQENDISISEPVRRMVDYYLDSRSGILRSAVQEMAGKHGRAMWGHTVFVLDWETWGNQRQYSLGLLEERESGEILRSLGRSMYPARLTGKDFPR